MSLDRAGGKWWVATHRALHTTAHVIRSSCHLVILSSLLFLLALPIPAHAREDGPGDGVSVWTVDTGGGASSGGGYRLTGTAGQTDATTARLSAGGYELRGGFWHGWKETTSGSGAEHPTLFLPLIGKEMPQPYVYHEDFEDAVGGEWPQHDRVTTSPSGQRFLGEFGNQIATLRLADLPSHNQVTVAFDLYLLRSWDGNQVSIPDDPVLQALLVPTAADGLIGPDRWQLRADGQALLDTTFANIPGFRQAYPGGDHPARTGATAVNSLGYVFGDAVMDTIYRVERTFAHSGRSLALDFQALGLQIPEDESWGIDNITVTVQTIAGVPGEAPAQPEPPEVLWIPAINR